MSELEEALAETEADLDRIQAELDRLKAEMEAISAERRGLELALARRKGRVAPAADLDAETRERWLALQRTDAVERVLNMRGIPLSPRQITDYLHEAGRDDSYEAVAATLDYLRRQERVVSQGRGQWITTAYQATLTRNGDGTPMVKTG